MALTLGMNKECMRNNFTKGIVTYMTQLLLFFECITGDIMSFVALPEFAENLYTGNVQMIIAFSARRARLPCCLQLCFSKESDPSIGPSSAVIYAKPEIITAGFFHRKFRRSSPCLYQFVPINMNIRMRHEASDLQHCQS